MEGWCIENYESLRLWFVDAGYHTIQYTLTGLILGLMS